MVYKKYTFCQEDTYQWDFLDIHNVLFCSHKKYNKNTRIVLATVISGYSHLIIVQEEILNELIAYHGTGQAIKSILNDDDDDL